jgi:hypothetical protein
MFITRRRWLSIASAGACAALAPPRLAAAGDESQADLERRISRIVDEYSRQGFHRTGTRVDNRSGDWLCEEVRRADATPARDPFSLSRVDPGTASLSVGGRRIEGLPLFDGAFTGAGGVRGRLGPAGSDAEIGVAEGAPNTAGGGPLGDARRQQRHKALVFVTRGGRPGLCPSNADSFLAPFGPPVLQVSSDALVRLREHTERRSEAHLIAPATRTNTSAFNVTARIKGKSARLLPLVVMTPRSGWYSCASERGGGIACWLALMRSFVGRQPARDVVFVASSGHELGHLGIDAFIARNPGIVKDSAAWIHLGANIGAALHPAAPAPADGDPARRHAAALRLDARPAPVEAGASRSGRAAGGFGNTIQASDDELEGILSRAMAEASLGVSRRNPRGAVPGGEAEAVHRGGGRYLSVIGANALFHNPADRGAAAVTVEVVARFTRAFASVAALLDRLE